MVVSLYTVGVCGQVGLYLDTSGEWEFVKCESRIKVIL